PASISSMVSSGREHFLASPDCESPSFSLVCETNCARDSCVKDLHPCFFSYWHRCFLRILFFSPPVKKRARKEDTGVSTDCNTDNHRQNELFCGFSAEKIKRAE